MKIIDRKCDGCDIEFKISKALSKQSLNQLNRFYEKCYDGLI